MKPRSSPSVIYCISLLLSCATFTFSSGEAIFKDGLKNFHELKLPINVSGPESLEFDCKGEGPYTGVSDGRILKWKGSHKGWVEFALTSPHRDRKLCDGSTDPNNEPKCGRPLGLKFDRRTCNLYIADAYFGLLIVGPGGGVAQQLAISADGVPFRFLNGVDVDERTGVVYISDSSAVYQRRDDRKIFQRGDKTGRLMKYNPSSKKIQVLLQDLAFANGVALSKDGSFVLLAEFMSKKIHKFWLKGSKAYTSQLFAQFERSPDNIKRNRMGHFWVGLNSNRTSSNADNGGMHNQTQVPWRKGQDPVGVKFDDKGKILEVLDGRGGQELEAVSEVKEHNGSLWVGSVSKDYAVVVKV